MTVTISCFALLHYTPTKTKTSTILQAIFYDNADESVPEKDLTILHF